MKERKKIEVKIYHFPSTTFGIFLVVHQQHEEQRSTRRGDISSKKFHKSRCDLITSVISQLRDLRLSSTLRGLVLRDSNRRMLVKFGQQKSNFTPSQGLVICWKYILLHYIWILSLLYGLIICYEK